MKILSLKTTAAGVVWACLEAQAADWTQYRGPNHDGTSAEKISMAWPANGPAKLWAVPLTDGFSAMTVAGGKAFTLVTRDVDGAAQEVCVALDANSGKELWASPLGIAKYDGGGDQGTESNSGGDGPRSTPAYDDGRVYTYSARMVLKCLDAADGKEVWSSDLIKEHGGRNIRWENASSPLIDGNMVFVAAGGPGEALLAFDKKDGHVVWKGESDGLTQSTPVAATILGERQVIFFTQKGLVAVAAKTGAVLWRLSFGLRGAAGISPVVSGDMVYISMAYGVGTRVCEISKTDNGFAARQLWFTSGNSLVNHWGTPVCANGYVYGIFGQAEHGRAPLKCVNMTTGEVKWSQDGFGMGGCTLVDGNVLVLSDAGDLVLVKAAPEGYTEQARSHVLAGKCWNYPAVSGGRIYARSTKEGVCVDVTPKSAAAHDQRGDFGTPNTPATPRQQ
jgi:outer membrane protein assembly factor BamB